MKFLTVLFFLGAAFAMAQANEHDIKKATEKAHKIIDKIQDEMKEIVREHHGHLLQLVDYYEDLTKTWLGVLENRSPIPVMWNEDQEKIVEAALSHTEERATEEMKTVKEYIKKNEHYKGDVKHLIESVNQSMEKANQIVEQLRHHHQASWQQVGELQTILHMLGTANTQLSHLHEGTDMRKSIEKVECLHMSLVKSLQHSGHNPVFF